MYSYRLSSIRERTVIVMCNAEQREVLSYGQRKAPNFTDCVQRSNAYTKSNDKVNTVFHRLKSDVSEA